MAISCAHTTTRRSATGCPRSTPQPPGTTTRLRTSCRRSSPGWSWWGRASPRRRPGGHGCPNRCYGTVRATCWPGWRAAAPDVRLLGYGPQWSPPSDGGSTRRVPDVLGGESVSAMEPAVERRERRSGSGTSWRSGSAAMEPAEGTAGAPLSRKNKMWSAWSPQWSPPVTRGNTILAQGAGLNYLLPQWSPPSNGGSTAPLRCPGPSAETCRNGARR